MACSKPDMSSLLVFLTENIQIHPTPWHLIISTIFWIEPHAMIAKNSPSDSHPVWGLHLDPQVEIDDGFGYNGDPSNGDSS